MTKRKDLSMTIRRLVPMLAAVAIAFTATAAHAQQEGTKVGVCNPARVFSDMMETKDLKQAMENQRKSLEQQVNDRQTKVKDLQAQRDLLKQDSQQYQDADKKFMEEAIQFDTWSK